MTNRHRTLWAVQSFHTVSLAKAEAIVDDLRDLPRRSPAEAGIGALGEKEEGVEK